MTIAGGILCTDGAILCADTQETIGDYSKHDTSKIRSFHSNVFTVVMTGGGDSDYLEQAFEMINDACATVCDPTQGRGPTDREILDAIKGACADFFNIHLLPLASTPSERPEVHIVLAIVISPNRAYKVIKVRATTFLANQAYQFTGIGSDVAGQLYRKLFTSMLPMQQAAALAIHILGHVKKSVPYCGGNTDLFMTNRANGECLSIPTTEIKRLERLYEQLDDEAHHNLARRIIELCPSSAELVGFVTQSTSGTPEPEP